jgi:hypothetical protein
MPSPGRNDPCPCDSGRKFKQCCGGSVLPFATRPPTAADRKAGYELLDRIAALPRFADDVSLAYGLTWQGIPANDVDRLMDTQANDLFLEWVWFDYLLHTGQTVAEYALAKHASEVGPGARQFLRAGLAAPLRLLQVHSVEPGARVTVRDTIDKGLPMVVTERRGSQQLVRHDVMTARIACYGDEAQFEGMNLLLKVEDKAALAAAVRRARRGVPRRHVGPERDRVLRMVSGAAIVAEVIDLFDRPQPRVTVDGDEMAFADTIFSVLDAVAAQRCLDAEPRLERDTEPLVNPDELARYVWLEQPHTSGGGPTRILGSVLLGSKTMCVEVLSMPRAKLAHAWFSSLVPKAIRFQAIQVKSREAAAEAARSRSGPSQPELPPEVVTQIQRAHYEKHYREWLDIPVPALGHRTPREAARIKALRTKLVALVESIEVQAARSSRDGGGFEVAFLRRELGLRVVP